MPKPDPLLDALVQTSFATMGVLNRVAAENDLSLTQLRVLAILRDRRVRVTELAAHLGLDKSTLSGLIARAEQRGLVVRSTGAADRRVVEVRLSAAGARLADRLQAQVAAELAPLLDRFSAAESRRLTALLERALG